MSWIKQMFAKIMNDRDENRNENIDVNKKTNEANQGKLNMRMTYQYPNNNFRFPLIDHVPKNDEKIKKKKVEEKIQHNKTDINRRYGNKKEPHRKKIEPIITQPFKPTDIPSPIHGYQSPPQKKEKTLEYELQDHFLHDKTVNHIQDSTADVMVETELFEEAVPEQLEPIMIADEEFSTNDKEEVINNLDEDKVYETIIEEKVIEQEPHISLVEEDPSPNPPVIFNHQEVEMVEEVSVTTENVEEIEAHIPEEEKKPKKRPQMPFNVLMLKEDREKWQQKKRERSQEESIHVKADKMNQSIITQFPDESEGYKMPSLRLLHPPVTMDENREWLEEQSSLLNETLNDFNVKARVVHVSQGPSVTRFEVQPEPGVKVSRITNLSDDIKLSMAAKDIRIEAPIPGKRSVGIELPNQKSRPVQISEILGDPTFQNSDSQLTAALGLDISGDPVITDLRKMPHGLIAGATGSGKSVCINSILVSLLYKATPDELKLLLIDPKMVELAPYNHIPHLVSPVITDVKAATAALKWTVDEMERRYELFAHGNVRDIHRFNKIAKEKGKFSDLLPYIVVVIDELADLMMMAPADVEESICRIAQKARACGIHLLIATQRPSVDVITGLIKANVPTRVAFSVSSQVDSRTIIDISGAEKLLGRGDMLFLDSGSSKPVRLQGTFVSDEEIDRVIDHVRSQGEPNYLFEQEELLKKAQTQEDEDELFMESCEFIVSQGSASTSLLQRHFRIGYNRAARLIFMMEERGLISEARGSKARDVLIGEKELTELKETTLL